jgi:hypothetical protein
MVHKSETEIPIMKQPTPVKAAVAPPKYANPNTQGAMTSQTPPARVTHSFHSANLIAAAKENTAITIALIQAVLAAMAKPAKSRIQGETNNSADKATHTWTKRPLLSNKFEVVRRGI